MSELEGIDRNTDEVKKVNFSSIGSTGLERQGGYVYEEFLTSLTMPSSLKVWKEMRNNDPVIGAIFFLFEQMVRRTPWYVEAGGTKLRDQKMKEFIEQALNDMNQPWTETVVDIMSFLVYGWSWHEVVYKLRGGKTGNKKTNSKYDDGYIGWRKIEGRSQDSWNSWIYDKNDNLIAMDQIAPPSYERNIIPLSKSLLFRTTTARDNPEGRSLLRNAYRPWYFKKKIEEIEAIGIERELAGLPVLTPPENTNIWDTNDDDMVRLKGVAERIVSNIRQDKSKGVLKPFGWELELLASGGKRQIDTNKVINRYDQRIASSLLADIILLGAEKMGSFALAEVKESLIAASLEALLHIVADTVNTYAVPKLIDMNGFTGYTDYPKMVPGEVEVPDMRELADIITRFRKLGVQFFPDEKLENKIRNNLRLPEKDIKEGYEKDFDELESLDKNPSGVKDAGGKVNQYDETTERETEDKKPYNDVYQDEGRKDK